MTGIREIGFSKALTNLINELKSENDQKHMIHLSLNLECIEGLTGVSASCISGGFTISEATKLFYEAGLQLGGAGLLASVDVCEYNPCVEDWRTGRQIAAFFYYFALGLSKGLQENIQN